MWDAHWQLEQVIELSWAFCNVWSLPEWVLEIVLGDFFRLTASISCSLELEWPSAVVYGFLASLGILGISWLGKFSKRQTPYDSLLFSSQLRRSRHFFACKVLERSIGVDVIFLDVSIWLWGPNSTFWLVRTTIIMVNYTFSAVYFTILSSTR